MASRAKVAILEMWEYGIRVTPSQRCLLWGMSEYEWPEGFCWYTADTIAKFAGTKRRNGQRTMRQLVKRGVVRKWIWINPGGRQGANVYKVCLPGLAPVTEETIRHLRNQRGGAPAVGWEQLREDLGLPRQKPDLRGVQGDTPEGRHIDAPQTESRGVKNGPGGASFMASEGRPGRHPTHNVLDPMTIKPKGEGGAASTPQHPAGLPADRNPPPPTIFPDTPEEEKPQAVDEALYGQAVKIVRENQRASVSLLQRRLGIGYSRAARLIDVMSERGVVGPDRGSVLREVLPAAGDVDEEAAATQVWWTAICGAAEGGAPRRRKIAEACRMIAAEMARRWGADVERVLLHLLMRRPQAAASAETLCRYLFNGWGLEGLAAKTASATERTIIDVAETTRVAAEDEATIAANVARRHEIGEAFRNGGWEGFRAWAKETAAKGKEDAA